MKISILAFLIVAGFAGAQAQRAKSVLLPSDEAKKLANQCSRPSPSDFTDTWQPTAEQIKKMESKLDDIAELSVKSCCIVGASVERPNDWYMQYAALVWKGKKTIYISGISTQEPESSPCWDKDGIITDLHCASWKQRAAIVCDGGTQWGVIYDVETQKFSELAMNGVA